MKFLLTNAYSTKNAGDGLLVKLASSLIRESGNSLESIFALDSASFNNDYPKCIVENSSKIETLRNINKLPRYIAHSEINGALAVGGGYLRFGNKTEALKARLLHLNQLGKLVEAKVPFGLLPQSIGPLTFFERDAIKILGGADWIALRDDRSMDELSMLNNLVRMPDLAALEISEILLTSDRQLERRLGLIIRNLPHKPYWNGFVRDLINLPNSEVLIQSEVGRSNSDRGYVSKFIDCRHLRSSSHVIESGAVDVVLSVRLHGSLMAILAGVPSIHIAYERKSFGVYEDLGISKFCLNPNNLKMDAIVDMVEELSSKTGRMAFFDLIAEKQPKLAHKKVELLNLINSL
jgi:polysaccharide pyruvyl transferase WcaK-like protein